MSKKEFFGKLSAFRKLLNEQDWTPDGTNTNQGYMYLTNKKIKANFSKCLVQAGLEWRITFPSWRAGEPIGSMKNHYYVDTEAVIYDIEDPDCSVEYFAVGEAADSGDKAYKKACTAGLVTILSNNFLFSELDSEGEEIQETNDSIKAQSKSGFEAKQSIVKEKVVRQSSPTPAPVPAPVLAGNVSATQRTVLEKIIGKARIMSDSDLAPFGPKEQIESDYAEVKSADDAMNFITAYQGILRCP